MVVEKKLYRGLTQFFSALSVFMDSTTITQPARLPIPSASKYEIDEHGIVYRNNKRLRLQKRGTRWFAQVYDDNRKRHSFDSEKLAQKLFGIEPPTLSLEDICDTLNARPVPEWRRYAVTNYGAVYCIDPPKRGRNAGERYMVRASLKNGNPYMNLYDYSGIRRAFKVDDIVRMAWPY